MYDNYPQVSKDKLLRNTNLKEVLEFYGAKFVNNKLALCCCHEDKKPSLSIYCHISGIIYFKCFATGNSGNVIDLVMLKENLNFKEAINFIMEAFYHD